MDFKLQYTTDAYSTHQPVLLEVVKNINNGIVIECGCGFGSTPLLLRVCKENNNQLYSYESDADWINQLNSLKHNITLVQNWYQVFIQWMLHKSNIDCLFVDQSPWEARAMIIQRLSKFANYTILHDCDYLIKNNMIDVSALFNNNYEIYVPPKPWAYQLTGPPTMVASKYKTINMASQLTKYGYNKISLEECKQLGITN